MRINVIRPRHTASWMVCGLVILALLTGGATSALAQGTIYGAVQNSDGSIPTASDLRWWGFLDDRDEEIRIETNTGAGYDGANWFDDFQNYTTEAAGNPYDYFFSNLANHEAFHLDGLIPDNSFQQEDVTLAATADPAQPTGLVTEVLSPTEVRLSWPGVAGVSYHIYRRVTENNGVFFRIDDPSGSLDNPGIGDSTYTDDTISEPARYTYLIIGEDALGGYSPHSEEITVEMEAFCDCGVPGDIDCDDVPTPLDVIYLVNYVYRQWPFPECDRPDCPYEIGDMNCDGSVDPRDVARIVPFVYKDWPTACDCCDPQTCLGI